MKETHMQILSTHDIKTVKASLTPLYRPADESHKGQNGRVLVIGGSVLFHSSLIWAATIASKLVDMVHVASPAETNEAVVREYIKKEFLDGIVVPWQRVEEYIVEDDVILIGPGMPRQEGLEPGETPTKEIVNQLVSQYPHKKWVIDGGALQEIEPALLTETMIVTPHVREWERLLTKISRERLESAGVTILLKGKADRLMQGDMEMEIVGGNAGMTKGGTGDVLAGLVAAFYAKNEAWMAAQTASVVNKRAGDRLYQQQSDYYNASDLVQEIPREIRLLIS